MKGKFKARGVSHDFGATDKGSEYVAVLFVITQGEHEGQHVQWKGFFTEKTTDRTLDSLRHCGWAGDDIMALDGLDANEVEIDVDEEKYEDKKTGEWKTATKVNWVNKPARVHVQNQMSGQKLAEFAARLRGKAIAHKKEYGGQPAASKPAPRTQTQNRPPDASFANDGDPGPTDDDIPF